MIQAFRDFCKTIDWILHPTAARLQAGSSGFRGSKGGEGVGGGGGGSDGVEEKEFIVEVVVVCCKENEWKGRRHNL